MGFCGFLDTMSVKFTLKTTFPSAAAYIIVDLQNDFLEHPFFRREAMVAQLPVVLAVAPLFSCIITTQDWHPDSHVSFVTSHPGRKVLDVVETSDGPVTLWPKHCVQESRGAQLHPILNASPEVRRALRIYKGTDANYEMLSAFKDSGQRSSKLANLLRERQITHLFIAGFALDYCVKATALDAVAEGFKVTLITNATTAATAEGERQTLTQLKKALVRFATFYP